MGCMGESARGREGAVILGGRGKVGGGFEWKKKGGKSMGRGREG